MFKITHFPQIDFQFNNFRAIDGSMKDIPSTYFHKCYNSQTPSDKILNLAIVLESTMLAGKNQELNYRLFLRTSAFLEQNVKKLLETFYTLRSEIVHNGTVPDFTCKKGKKDIYDTLVKITGLERNDCTELIFYFIKDHIEPIVRKILKKSFNIFATNKKIQMDGATVAQQAIQQGSDKSQFEQDINKGLSIIEKMLLDYQEQSGDRVCLGEAVKHQLVAGNVFLIHDITTNKPLKDLFAVTIADYTFILNKTVITALKSDKYPNPYRASALIFVRQGNYTTDHVIRVNGTEVASYTSTSDLATTKTNNIATELYNGLVNKLGTTNWNISRSGSVICLQKKDGEEYIFNYEIHTY